jgi:hypothetical protein
VSTIARSRVMRGVSSRPNSRYARQVDWPHLLLSDIPSAQGAKRLAATVLEQACDPLEWARLGGFRPYWCDLASDRDGVEALLIPLPDRDAFNVALDVRPRGGWQAGDEELARLRWLFAFAHEIGHSFFYIRSPRGPQRYRSSSQAEERFCDSFAAALAGLPGMPERDGSFKRIQGEDPVPRRVRASQVLSAKR